MFIIVLSFPIWGFYTEFIDFTTLHAISPYCYFIRQFHVLRRKSRTQPRRFSCFSCLFRYRFVHGLFMDLLGSRVESIVGVRPHPFLNLFSIDL